MGTSTQFELHFFLNVCVRGSSHTLHIEHSQAFYAPQQLNLQDRMIATA